MGNCYHYHKEKPYPADFQLIGLKLSREIKIQHRKQNCLDCNKGKICSDCAKKPKKNSFICEIEKACKLSLDLKSQKKTYSTKINMLKRKPATENYQILPYYEGKYGPKQNKIVFVSAKEILMQEYNKMVVKM